ncbi:DUF3307 domain-containing protein (plasmid) [Kitasatospora sp. NBC_00374]|uniref:DUF3307 domain-containing protein n=1 Tax=Kitasatospora sp. NBC_00374 TaxID=2975964 RepID=UPI002F90A1A6
MTSADQIAQAVTLATFATVWATLAVGHTLADHVFGQTDHQASNKGAPTADEVAKGVSPRRGWGACLAHVTQYHLVLGLVLALVRVALPLQLPWPRLAAALALSAVTHAFFDRRWPVRWVLEHTGSPGFAKLQAAGLNGLYLADQALHQTVLLLAALVITLP